MKTLEEKEYILEEIERLGDAGKYEEQGKKFLEYTETTLSVVECVPQTAPIWAEDGKHGIKYAITLKNSRYSYTFDYWGSIHDREMLSIAEQVESRLNSSSPQFFQLKDFLQENGFPIGMTAIGFRAVEKTREAIKPTAYDILACLDVLYSDTFDDFCSDFGYDTDSIKAEKIYKSMQEQDRALRKLFTMDEIDLLNMI